MSDPYDHEVLLDEPGYPSERSSIGVAGIVVGLLVGGVVLLGLVVGGRAAADWLGGLTGLVESGDQSTEVTPGQHVQIGVPSGSSARQIGSILVENAVIASSSTFEGVVRSRDVANQLKAGEYEFISGMEIDTIVDVLIEGPNITTFRVMVVEGRRIGEVMSDLARQSAFEEPDFIAALVDGSVQSIYLPSEIGGIQAWEGLLFPDTYEFFGDATPPEMLQRMANEMERRVSQLSWDGVMGKGLSIYEAVIMASMVEAEAAVDDDRPLIASVLYNRLDEGMLLQIDATVLYALGQRSTGLTTDDLEVDSPYNTYGVLGLPPTPIGALGFKSLEAISVPATTDFLYYVLTAEDGSHTFTNNYDDFLAAKEQARADGFLP